MTSAAAVRSPAMNAGLCETCRHQYLVRNTRGSSFSRCERSKTDPRYPKYPRIPVTSCEGHERRDGARRAT
jgi:hypothetical protein